MINKENLLSIEQRKEFANALTHGLGFLFFLVAVPVLMNKTAAVLDFRALLATGVFGLGLLFVYLSSTLYHTVSYQPLKRALRIVDHIAIYFLIAGTYTPFICIFIWTKTSSILLIFLWLLVAAGIVYKISFTGKFRLLSTLMYIAMGCLALFFLQPLYQELPSTSFYLLLVGGLSYILGSVFYMWKGFPYHHAIWHIFVMIGSIAHFSSLLFGIYSLS